MIDMSFAVGDKVKICNKPLSVLQSHANKTAEIVKKGFGNKWLLRINGDLWWVKEFDFEKEEEDLFPFSLTDKMEKEKQIKLALKQYDRLRL